MLSMLEGYRNNVLETLFGNVEHCIVVVDCDGNISYMNESYCHFLEVDLELVTGLHVTEVIENTRMHHVVDSGKEEMADLQQIRGDYMVAHRIPLWENGELIGALGMVLFRDTDEWKIMNSHIKDLLLELETYRNQMQQQNGAKYSLHDIITSSPDVLQLKEKIRKTAHSNVSVLLRGESGTGKELFAHSIHHLSERSTKPFVKVNCAAIPEHLIEAELFGYQEGAFTGAKKGGKPGKFQLAHGGTLFLDEIGDMPLQAQVKILRALQEGEVEAVGANHPQEVDVRIVAATNQSLEAMIQEQRFREDLFYRINVVQMDIPPLRDRKDDIKILSKYLLEKVNECTGKRVSELSPTVKALFQKYHWLGNVRELENVIESAVHMTDSETIVVEDLPPHLSPEKKVVEEGSSLKRIVEQTEKHAIEKALKETDGDKSAAATQLGIGKSSLYEKVKKYSL
ncbi:Transcriptional regulator containing PAS, AAA-type ATPase, and DNA-binding Fis domains [Halobacillus dabanensis]|uniref:Transcriptional regulator containing PAS, AAA-type ATPase, and DNA-binding Fis domains n=1 Tax=Halobacillus dabanensis TaxID=240302 RepID=A0A1I3WR47_HALDA|nr:sigma 54-interacting transcriptional regulator [Halobacillus dabanensis]SFK10124.1 Transcriptional regulator containing PAS, AAA-type ATPase, and DNA-binding Fis domains [Halobacillus dabanensis]